MKKYYKLTTQKMQTRGEFQWKLGVWHEAKGDKDQSLCTNGWLHCYDSLLLAVLHNPIHANIKNPRLFEVEVNGPMKNDRGMKRGFRKMKLVKEISLVKVTTEQRIKYGIFCAKSVYDNKKFNKWADNWLSGKDRSEAAAGAAEAAAWAAAEVAWAAESAEAVAAAEAAGAARAARAAAWAAAWAEAVAAGAARAAAWAAEAVAEAEARAAAWAAAWAEAVAVAEAEKIDLVAIAEKAMEV